MTFHYICEKCDYECFDTSNKRKHEKTSKHLGFKKFPEKVLFECIPCNYTCHKQSLVDKHTSTKKHLKSTKNVIEKTQLLCAPCANEQSTIDKNSENTKISGKVLTSYQPYDYASMITQLLDQNSELKKFIIDQANEHKKETAEIVNKVIEQANEHKKDTLDIVTKVIEQSKPSINTNITNNKAFNINMYLNENCKNAIDFSDFIKSIEITYEDLENNAQLGFVDGMSKIFIDSLNKLEKNKRPMHCTDAKRETMYIKDDGKWVKETTDAKLQKGIQTVSYKSIGKLMEWKKENPDYRDSDSKFSNQCMVMHKNSIAGYDRDTYYPKVIHSIAKEIVVDK